MLRIVNQACAFTQVSESRLQELERLYQKNKNKKRVLFVKDNDFTYLKTLPNLPDDEENITECNIDDEEGLNSDEIDES